MYYIIHITIHSYRASFELKVCQVYQTTIWDPTANLKLILPSLLSPLQFCQLYYDQILAWTTVTMTTAKQRKISPLFKDIP